MEQASFDPPQTHEPGVHSRRWFLSHTGAVAAGVAVLGADVLLSGCGDGEQERQSAPVPDETEAAPTAPAASEAPKTSGEFSAKPTWEQNFADMQSGPVDTNVWTHETNPEVPTYNDEKQAYTPKNVRIEQGRGLLIEARKENYTYPDGTEYDITSGRIDTRDSFSFQYGKFEVEMKMPAGKGTWPAFWFLSASQAHTNLLNPTEKDWEGERFYMKDGELDGVEYYGHTPGVAEATLHTFAKSVEGHMDVPDAETAFHTYGVEVTPTEVRWTIDGKTYFKYEKPSDNPDKWPFGENKQGEPNEFYPILNLAMGGSGGGSIDASKKSWTLEVKRATFFEYASQPK